MTDDECTKPGCLGGHQPGKCAGHRSDGSGRPCTKWAVKGLPTCRSHGAASPNAKAAAAARLAEEKLAAELEQEGRKILRAASKGALSEVVPARVLLESVAMMRELVEFQRHQLADIEGQPSTDTMDRYAAHIDKLGRVAKLADDARLGERALQLQEEQAQFLVRLLEAAVLALGDLALQRVLERLDDAGRAVVEGCLVGVRVLDPVDPRVRGIVAKAAKGEAA